VRDSTSANGVQTFHYRSAYSSADEKSVLVGTHRICTPEETLTRVQPFLSHMGITRVAEITHLDDLGIPTFQAIRPNSRNISVSQGKGITQALARVSAIMESIEGWHAEEPALPSTQATVGNMAAQLSYSLYHLNLSRHHLIHDALELEWFPASILHPSAMPYQKTYVPADLVRLDFTVRNEWRPPTFSPQSNGLASGNSFEEAALHALYEVIERDTFERVRRGNIQKRAIDLNTVDGVASSHLIEKLQQAQATIQVSYACGATGIACFEAMITSPSYPIVTGGCGCHLDRDVALSRALTEAAQSRLTMIAGSRDDLSSFSYKRLQSRLTSAFFSQSKHQPRSSFQDVFSSSSLSLKEDLDEVIRRVISAFDTPPILVDLTRREFTIPVVFVIVPHALCWESLK
jgi:YcaO-like protein with predicted kinase domain